MLLLKQLCEVALRRRDCDFFWGAVSLMDFWILGQPLPQDCRALFRISSSFVLHPNERAILILPTPTVPSTDSVKLPFQKPNSQQHH